MHGLQNLGKQCSGAISASNAATNLANMPASGQKWVYPATEGGWFVKFKGDYLGYRKTKAAAKALLNQHIGEDASRGRGAQREPRGHRSKYKGVCFHKGIGRWVAQHGGRTVGTHITEEGAAKVLLDHLEIDRKQLLRKTECLDSVEV